MAGKRKKVIDVGDAPSFIDVSSIVSDTFPLTRVGEAFRAASDRVGLKIIVCPSA